LAAAKKAKASPKGKMWAKAVRNATASSSDLGSSGSALPLAGARPNRSMIDLDEDVPAGLPTVDSQARSISKLHIAMAGGAHWFAVSSRTHFFVWGPLNIHRGA
jgi:hypothetical protein